MRTGLWRASATGNYRLQSGGIQGMSGQGSVITRKHTLGFCAAIIVSAAIGRAAEAATIVVFDPPGSGGTYPFDIDDKGTIAGGWFDVGVDVGEGFIRTSDGVITTFAKGGDHPKETAAYGINDKGEATGYDRQHGGLWGFIRTPGGKIRSFQAQSGRGYTYPVGINRFGVIAGTWTKPHDKDHGFVRTRDGTITLFDAPDDVNGTDPTGINTGGSIVGTYEDADGGGHGFLRTSDGTIATFDAAKDAILTVAEGLNDAGTTTGFYFDSSEVYHDFVRTADGMVTTFDPSGALATYAMSINNNGAITGSYVDGGYATHGFVRSPDGTMKTFDPPGSAGTNPSRINSKGDITGTFYDGSYHGFVRSK